MILIGILLTLLVIVLAGFFGYVIVIYNGLIGLKNNIDKSWSNIDVLLKQRFDEIPKLVNVCKGYMKHERQTLEAVVRARSHVGEATSDKDILEAQSEVSGALKSLFAVVENYPNLKADASFLQLQSRISDLEDQIADRREFFNESVNIYNIRIEQFPDMFVASAFHFERRLLWEIDPSERNDVEVEFQRA